MKYYLCLFLIFTSFLCFSVENKETIKKKIEKEVIEAVQKKKEKATKKKKTKKSKNKSSQKSSTKSTKKSKETKSEVLLEVIADSSDASLSSTDGVQDSTTNLFSNNFFTRNKSTYLIRNMVIFQSQYNFQYWKPTFIEGSKVNTTILNYAVFELSFLKKLYRIRYEKSFGGSSDEAQNELLKKRKKDNWEKILADINIPTPITIYISYICERFSGTVTALEDKTYIPDHYDSEADDISEFEFLVGEEIEFNTNFQDFLLGVSTVGDQGMGAMGIFYTRYQKPYSLTLDDDQNRNYIFNSCFGGGGFFGKLNIETENAIFSLNGKYGIGSIHLPGIDLHIEDLIEDGYITYGDIEGSTLLRKSSQNGIFSVYAGLGARYRRFVISIPKDEEAGTDSDSIFLNSDTIFNVQCGFSINL